MHRKQRRILKVLALGIAVAGVAAPTTLAEPRGPGNYPLDAKAESTSVSPDDRAFDRGAPAAKTEQNVSVSPDDRPLFRGVETPNVASSPVAFYRSDEFQWREAGVGAATMFGLLLLGGATTLVVRRQRRQVAT